MKALIGTPAGFSHSGSIDGHCAAGAVKREFGCAAGRPQPGVQSLPFQSIRCAGGFSVMPSHQTSPSSVSAMLVKIVFFEQLAIAFGLDLRVGARRDAEEAGLGVDRAQCAVCAFLIQAMSSPTVVTFQPSKLFRRHQHGEVGLAAGARESGARDRSSRRSAPRRP